MDVVVGSKYRHFKGHIITVLHIAKDSEDLSLKVVYRHEDTGEIWVRDYDMFISKVDKEKYPNVLQEYRFEKVD